MKTHTGELKKFRKKTRYVHNRSEGLTHRNNGGTSYQKSVILRASCVKLPAPLQACT